ncbi:Reductase C-terminal [Nocardia amikacinitolerans]|uniref:NAD(P)/FAD-dependent oxidoreductase n=1 Tax=Nocardia amikacinitolerans TaxID=756689 RepID=UPI000831B18B|nr:FAD-dependent oxidoreductase [Nocardia amikacinitolerans]MCP2321245.1 Reductase C-terminal [Nocardia amikacinitolerans]
MIGSVVIVGGGIAGLSTAAALRSGGFVGDITLVDASEFPYDRPPLSKEFLAGTKRLTEISLQPPQWYDDQKVRLVSNSKVTALRPSIGEVELFDGTTIPADRVVLATGGRAARPPIPGSQDARVHVLRTATDAERLRAALQPGARLLVVGAGLIGAEVASTAVDLDCEVALVDPLRPPLTHAVGSEIAAWLHDLHIRRGVVSVRSGVESLRATPSGIEAHLTSADRPREFDVVVLGVGMVPETTLAETAGLEVDRGIVVDRTQTTSNPAVLAVGDPARVRDGGALLPRTEHWEAAQRDGQRAAATILGAPPPADTAPWFWTDRHHVHVEVVGDMAAAERTVLRGTVGDVKFSAFGLTGGRVVGAVAVNDSTAVRAARRLIDRGIVVDTARLTDPATDLRQLLLG